MNHLIVPKVNGEVTEWGLNRNDLLLLWDSVSAPRTLNEATAGREVIENTKSYAVVFSRINLNDARSAAAKKFLHMYVNSGQCTIWFHRNNGAPFNNAEIDDVLQHEGRDVFDKAWVESGRAIIQNYSKGASGRSQGSLKVDEFKKKLTEALANAATGPSTGRDSAINILDEATGIKQVEREDANAFQLLERLFPRYLDDPEGVGILPSDMAELAEVLQKSVDIKHLPSEFRPRFKTLAEHLTERLRISGKLLPIP
mgnify:CR=1 FL=1